MDRLSRTLSDGPPEREWSEGQAVFICPPPKDADPNPCDCGNCGRWEYRPWFVWHDETDDQRRKRERRGHVALPGHGSWVIAGYEERCPGCGDIERFDEDGHLVERRQEQARVLTFMDFYRRKR
jgi:hypothetical protein